MTENSMIEELIAEFTEHYMEKLFYFCLKKTGNSIEAEDLTQDIALNILTALNKGTIPDHFSAWVWRIARNRYSVWADAKHRKSESITGVDLGDYELEDHSESTLDRMIRDEQLSLLRRELAFIGSEYRSIVVAYYIDHMSIREIAASLSLSEGSVKQRLYRARKILKEGMNMAREFGVRSYKPEEIYYSLGYARHGKKDQPNSIMTHTLYVNIFLEAYGNPSTAEELSLELGVALPYMENELEYLTRETFLIKKDGKYQTSFPIISRAAQDEVHVKRLTAAPEITKTLADFVDRLNRAFIENGNAFYGRYSDYESAKWALLMLAHQYFEPHPPHLMEYSERPDDGIWDIIGYQQSGGTRPSWFVANWINHGSHYTFEQFRFGMDGTTVPTSPFLTEEETKVLYNAVAVKLSEEDTETAEALAERGYLRRIGDVYEPVVTLTNVGEMKKAIEAMDEKTVSELTALADKARQQLEALYQTTAETIYADLPATLSDQAHRCASAISDAFYTRGYIIAEALRQGYLLPAEKVSKSIGAWLDLMN